MLLVSGQSPVETEEGSGLLPVGGRSPRGQEKEACGTHGAPAWALGQTAKPQFVPISTSDSINNYFVILYLLYISLLMSVILVLCAILLCGHICNQKLHVFSAELKMTTGCIDHVSLSLPGKPNIHNSRYYTSNRAPSQTV